MLGENVIFSSNTDEWSTPSELFDELNKEFHFTLDPCADKQNHKCDTYFTMEQDGLKQDWGGHRVFCNPPYGRGVGAWVEKCYMHTNLAVMLLPARTDTKWFHDWIYKQAFVEIRFIKGRLKFGGAKNNAPFPCMIVVFR